MSIEQRMSAVCESLALAMSDAAKFDSGNSSAGTRVRKAAMSAIKALKEVRTAVQDQKNAG
jgi:hypothetical protein